MFNVVLHGSRYALIGENVTYDFERVELPPNVSPADVTITWYKDGNIIKQYDWESIWSLELYDVGYPAEGNYYAIIEAGEYHTRSNSIYLEIGTERRQVTVNINTRTLIEANIGDSIQLHPSCSVQPPYAHYSMLWTKETSSTPLGPDEFVTIHINSDDDYGNYILHTEAFAHGGFNPAHATNILKIVPHGTIEEVCPNIYIHDLIPGRNAGYLRVGYWVIDEIFSANRREINWEVDPFDIRLKYHCEIANIVEGLRKWPDLEVQESRHGYILNHLDLHKTDLNWHKGLRKEKL